MMLLRVTGLEAQQVLLLRFTSRTPNTTAVSRARAGAGLEGQSVTLATDQHANLEVGGRRNETKKYKSHSAALSNSPTSSFS